MIQQPYKIIASLSHPVSHDAPWLTIDAAHSQDFGVGMTANKVGQLIDVRSNGGPAVAGSVVLGNLVQRRIGLDGMLLMANDEEEEEDSSSSAGKGEESNEFHDDDA